MKSRAFMLFASNWKFVNVDMGSAMKQWHALCEGIASQHSWVEHGSDLHQQKLVIGIMCHRNNGSFRRHALRERVLNRRLSQ